jgi:hypothetical protein
MTNISESFPELEECLPESFSECYPKSVPEFLPECFQVKFGSNISKNKYLFIADATKLPIKLYKCNPKDYDSIVCMKMMVTLTDLQIEKEINKGTIILSRHAKLYSNQNILVMTSEFVRLPKYIRNSKEYLEYLMVADRLCIEISRICNIKNTYWLCGKLAKIKDMYIAYEKLFTPVEEKYFNTKKFAPVQTNNAAPYPVGNPQNHKSSKKIKMNISPTNKKNNVHIYLQILSILNAFKSYNNKTDDIRNIDNIINKIIIILFGNIHKYHYAFNKDILKEIQNSDVFHEILKYPLRQMYLKEQTYYKFCHNKPNIDISSIILPIDIACLLPADRNLSGQYNTSVIKFGFQWLTAPFHISGTRGIYNLNEFTSRFYDFTNGAFEKVAFNRYNNDGSLLYKIGLTGSMISACAIKNPREPEFNTFSLFLNKFYPVSNNITITKTHTNNNYNKLFEEIYDTDSDESGTNTDDNDSDSGSDSDSDSDTHTNTSNNTAANKMTNVADIDVAVECDFNDFDKSVDFIYNDIKLMYPGAVLTKVITENKHKYIIDKVPRTIDIFHCNSISHVVSKFHLDCVRAWYDGEMVYCFPTFICAAHTGMCTDIRWVSNQKDPRDMIIKYYLRGFGTYINKADLASLKSYLTPANGYISTGLTPNLSNWKVKRIMGQPLYGKKTYFGKNYATSSKNADCKIHTRFPPFLKNKKINMFM